MSASPRVACDAARVRYRLIVSGAVQGVGFRPFVFRAARALGLDGWVANSADGVTIEIEGPGRDCEAFIARLRASPPALAAVDALAVTAAACVGASGFEIRRSDAAARVETRVMPDLATCDDCLAEIFDPRDRRYRYPFTNCTRCGPRFSVIDALPYERMRTSMRSFRLCPSCAREYADPADRRFHAEATACPDCGPQLELRAADGAAIATRAAALEAACEALRDGLVVAIKGLGGFHLCVDARSESAVLRLRALKRRPAKPFAVMFPTLRDIEACCHLDESEAALLKSPAAPIVLLARRRHGEAELAAIAEAVAPGNPNLGAMLPYTPLHHLIARELGCALVATSANVSDEPIVTDEHEAQTRLAGIADRFLVHDRLILRPVDDSVVRVVAGRPMMLRRSRGYAPAPIPVPSAPGPDVLALGAQLKSTIALGTARAVVPGQHLGTLSSPSARAAHARAVADFSRLFAFEPGLIACDLHPDYYTTRLAEQSGLPVMGVQHHVAHTAACMAEHGLAGPVLGVAWDGTGYGPDGTIWGGEFLVVERGRYRRVGRLRPFPLPGGERAVREPRRAAFGLLYAHGGRALLDRASLAPVAAFDPGEREVLLRMLERGVNSPVTSSVGRLFDAVSALAGLQQMASYEGEAAARLEWALGDSTGSAGPADSAYYEFAVRQEADSSELRWTVDWAPAVEALIGDLQGGVSTADISASFHRGLVGAIVEMAQRVGETQVVLTGGCFQNAFLTAEAVAALSSAGFTPYRHERVPPNDGGLALGQASFARWAAGGVDRCA